MSKNWAGEDNMDPLPTKGLRGKLPVNKQIYTWPPALPSVGSFDDLEIDDSRAILSIGQSCFSGLRCTLINTLERNFKFKMSHAFELGRKEEKLINGQKDGRKAQYSFGSFLLYDNFRVELAKSGQKRGELNLEYRNGTQFFSAFSMRTTPIKTDADFKFNVSLKDMNIEAKFANYNKSDLYPKTKIPKPEPAMSIGFTQPATPNIAIGTKIEFVPYTDKAQLKVIARHFDIFNNNNNNAKSTLSLTTGTMAEDKIQATYSQELAKNVTVVAATDLIFGPSKIPGRLHENEWKSISKLGYCLQAQGIEVTGSMDTDGGVNMVTNAFLGPDFVVTLSANCNYVKRKYDAGFGVQFPV